MLKDKVKVSLLFFSLLFIFFSCSITKSVKRPQKKAIKGSILYYSLIAQNHYNNRDYKKSIFNYEKILTKFKSEENLYQRQFAWTYYEIGYNYLALKNYPEALKNFQTVIENYTHPAALILARQRIDDINRITKPNDEPSS